MTELHHELSQLLQLHGVRVVMHTVRQRLRLLALRHLAYVLCHGLVSQQHELLYQFVGVERALEVTPHGLALLVNLKLHLLTVTLHRAVLEPALTQLLCQTVKYEQPLGVRVHLHE